MGNKDEATISTGEEDQVKTVKASDQSSKQRRADFIRQASQPLVKRTRSNTRSKSRRLHPRPESRLLTTFHETEEEHQPDGIAEEEEEDDQGPALHWRWVRTTESGKGWESFSVRDSRCLESAWKSWTQQQGGSLELPDLPRTMARSKRESSRLHARLAGPRPDEDPSPSKVAVAQDRLYDADIADFSMSPVFWRGPKLRITRASWFFESSKLTPCSTALAAELESHFQTLRPWFSSYTDELKSSVSLGSEAEAKLKCSLKTLKNSYVIFQGPRLARLYNEGFSNRLSKQFFTAWSGEHSGGQLLIRGYQTLVQLNEAKRGGAITKRPYDVPSRSQMRRKNVLPSQELPERARRTSRGAWEEALTDEQSDAVVVDDVATMDMDLSEHSSVKQDSPAQAPRSLPTSASQASLNVDRTHIEAAPSKIGARPPCATSPSWRLEAWRPTSAPANELLRSVASRLGVWNGAAQVSSSGEQESDTDSHQGVRGHAHAGATDDISESFKEAQRRIQDDLPAPATKPAETAAAVLEKQDQDATQDPEEGEWDDPDAFDDEEERREARAGSERPPELLLAIHGIGQRLAGEWKSFDFTLAINTFRALLQSRIETNKPPSDIGGRGLGGLAAQRHVQILPVHWQTGFHQMEDDEKWADHDSDAEDPLDDVRQRSRARDGPHLWR